MALMSVSSLFEGMVSDIVNLAALGPLDSSVTHDFPVDVTSRDFFE